MNMAGETMDRKLFWKFNIIDLILIALVMFSLLALVYKITIGNGEGEKSYEFICVCESGVYDLLNGINEGEVCADADLGTELGTVAWKNVEQNQSIPEKARGAIGVSVTAKGMEHGVNIGDSLYLKGQKIQLIVGDSVFDTYISDIKTDSQNHR